jgi:hypothetical protein
MSDVSKCETIIAELERKRAAAWHRACGRAGCLALLAPAATELGSPPFLGLQPPLPRYTS